MPPNHPRNHSRAREVMDGRDAFADNMAGARRAATSPWSGLPEPSERQKETGVYPKGYMTWNGLGILVENPAHTVREGTDPDGTPWRNVMKASYGYFAGTLGADGDEVDVFMGPLPEAGTAWVINQRNADGSFDEHKVLVGFHDERAAVDAYRLSYSAGWDRYGPPIALSHTRLQWWLANGDHTRELTPESVPMEFHHMDATKPLNIARVFWDSAAQPLCGQTIGGLLYELRVHDAADGLLLDGMTMADIMEGEDGKEVLDALVIQAGRLKPKMDALMRIMEVAGDTVKPIANQISDPVRRFGGAHVATIFELSDGQTVTAWFHNPDATPNKLSPADELVSWKWQLNKKDVTIVVAPESGQDLNLREVARRVMRLAAKNSAAFAKANAGRAGRMAEIQGLRDTLAAKQGELAGLNQQIEVAKVERDGIQSVSANLPAGWSIGKNAVGEYFAALRGAQYSAVGQDDSWKTPAEAAAAAARWAQQLADAQAAEREAAEPSDADKAAVVQAAYKFDNATTEFLAWLYGSIDSDSYSPFLTAKSMDAAAKAGGAGVIWDFFTSSPAMDAVGGFDIARNAAALGLQWSLKNLTLHDGDEHGWFKPFDNKAEAIQFLREAINVYRDESPAAAKEWLKKNRMGWKPSAKLDAVEEKKDGEEEVKPTAPAGSPDATEKGSDNAAAAKKADEVAAPAEGESKPADDKKPAADEGDDEKKTEANSGSESDDDTDAEQEFEATPEEDEKGEKPTMDGDFPGHPFRGNQYKHAGEHSKGAVGASMRAKHAEKHGNKASQRKSHAAAFHAHSAAAIGSKGKARGYHKKMAKFHAGRAGLRNDSIAILDSTDGTEYVGRIVKGGEVIGRIDIGGDGKGMVYVGESGGERPKSSYGPYYSQDPESVAELVNLLLAQVVDKWKAPTPTPEADAKTLVQVAIDELVSKGWTDEGDGSATIMFNGLGPLGTVNTPNGERRVRASRSLVTGKLEAHLGVKTICTYTLESDDFAIARRKAANLDEDVRDWVKSQQKKNGYVEVPPTATADDLFDQYREKVQSALEGSGATTSDAQGVIEANTEQLRAFFAEGKGPSAAAAELGNAAPALKQSFWVMLGDKSASEHSDLEAAIAAADELAATDPFANEGVWIQDEEGNNVRDILLPGMKTAATEDPNGFEVALLKDVNRGAHDTEALDNLLGMIEGAIQKLQAAGALTGENETIANNAITRWVELDQKANG